MYLRAKLLTTKIWIYVIYKIYEIYHLGNCCRPLHILGTNVQQIRTNNTLVHPFDSWKSSGWYHFLCIVKLLENTSHVFTLADHLVKSEKYNLFRWLFSAQSIVLLISTVKTRAVSFCHVSTRIVAVLPCFT